MFMYKHCQEKSWKRFPFNIKKTIDQTQLTMKKKNSAATDVLIEFKRRCINKEMKNGDKLPDQNQLANELGVSRISLREAIHTLTLMGALEKRPRFGTVVRSALQIMHIEYLFPPKLSDKSNFFEFMMFRKYIESAAVELAAIYAKKEDISTLEKLLYEMELSLKNKQWEKCSETDNFFHVEVGKASHNRFILWQVINSRSHHDQFMKRVKPVLKDIMKDAVEDHRKIFMAIKNRDPAAAKNQMKAHLAMVERSYNNYFIDSIT